ncbi:uncharacterized protein [Dermacentor andersoni]|uniref:uncharacterized protein isoform X2 n=1 Tax=Dermacentor andersoni TaxID=34620 RepID=UPI0024170F17|nr:uncharacterized protein LOC126544591 isoform X2 [Dermacentor andersoni]
MPSSSRALEDSRKPRSYTRGQRFLAVKRRLRKPSAPLSTLLAMTGVVLLRDFECGIPKDLRVTFVDELPEDALCIQCDNVSAQLYRDLLGHGYCTSCRAMCERGGAFACATCEKAYKTWELTADFSAPDKIKKLRVICPKSSEREPVPITFSALKAHLKQCFCNEVAKKTEGSSTRSYATVLSPPLSANQQSAAYSADKKEETIVVKVSVCPLCNDGMPRKLMRGHMKECFQKLQDSFLYEVSLPEVGMSHAANKFTAAHTSPFASGVCSSRQEHPVSSTESSKLARLLQEALSKISHLEKEVAELKKVANKEKGVMEMLQVAVPAIQGDMRNVQIRCEKRIAISEKSLKECHGSLQEALSVISEETKARLDAVEESMKDMNEKVSTVAHSLQEQSRYLHAANQLLLDQLEEITNNFYNVLNFVNEGQGKQAHGHSK